MNGLVVLWVLSFIVFRPDAPEDDLDSFETGTVTARSCAEAEAMVRGEMQPGQDVVLGDCAPVETREARR